MKRMLTGLLALLLVLAAAPIASAQTSFKFWTQVRDELGQPITTGVTCAVYNAGLDTRPTIYADASVATTKVNPVTGDSSGVCEWYATASTAVDLVVWTKRGRARHDNFTVFDHSVIVDKQSTAKLVRIPFTNSAGALTNTGVTIPKGALVSDVFIEVVTAVAAAHISIGLSPSEGGDAGGFCGGYATKVGTSNTGRHINKAGWVACHGVITLNSAPVSTWIDAYYSGFHSGIHLSRGAVGSTSTAANTAHAGSYIRFPYVGDGTIKTVVYVTNNKAVSGHFYIRYTEGGND